MSWYLVGMPVSTKPVRLGQSHLVVGVACSQSGYEVSAARAEVASCGYLLRDRTRAGCVTMELSFPWRFSQAGCYTVGIGVRDPCSALWDAGRSGLEGHVMATSMHRQRRNVNSADAEFYWGTVYYQESCVRGPVYQESWAPTFAWSFSSATGQ